MTMDRRRFTRTISTLALASAFDQGLSFALGGSASQPSAEDGSLSSLPANIVALIAQLMATPYASINTDWDGSIRIEGLLRLASRGNREALKFASAWLDYHLQHDKQLSDADYYKQYDGPHTRIIRNEPLTFTLYSANLGVAFPAYEIFRLNGNQAARQVCFEIADAVLQVASRDRFGMLSDDDDHFHGRQYAIPDTTYWATRACAIAAQLSPDDGVAAIYRQQAVLQLEAGIQHFFNPEVGLVRTGLFDGLPATTYWCRSQGWLSWAIAGLLRTLPSSHPKFQAFAGCMAAIGDAATKYQTADGAFHVLVNDPSTPQECTSVAMVLATLKEGMRKGWIPPRFHDFCDRAWHFVLHSVDPQGNVTNAYTGWAGTADELQVTLMDKKFRGFVPGVILVAADEMTRLT
jgi:Glycosyl Hydrolase Family 88